MPTKPIIVHEQAMFGVFSQGQWYVSDIAWEAATVAKQHRKSPLPNARLILILRPFGMMKVDWP